MFRVSIRFEETKLSNTVVEYKARNRSSLLPLYYLMLATIPLSLTTIIVVISSCRQLIVMNCLCVLTWIAYMVMVRFVVKEESIIIIKNFGIQLRIKYFFGADKNRFLEADKINGIFIHEYIMGSEVRYSVAFLIKDQTEILLLFKHLYPGSYDSLRKVCRQCKQNL